MQKTIKTGKPFRRQRLPPSGKKKLKKIIKKTAFLFSSVKNHNCDIQNTYNQIKDLHNKNELMKLSYEQKLGIESFKMQKLNNMFEDNVKHSWAADSERKKWICVKPFTSIDINTKFVHSCCSNYFKNDFSMGNAYTDTFDEVWNSDNAKSFVILYPRGILNIAMRRSVKPLEIHPSILKLCSLVMGGILFRKQ